MTVPQPLGTQPWEALKGSISCSQHCPRNKSDKIRRRGIRDELNQLSEVLQGACGGWWQGALAFCVTQCGWATSCSLTFSPSRHLGITTLSSPLILATNFCSGQRAVGRRKAHHFQITARSLPHSIYHRAMRKASMTHAAGDGGDRQARQARSPHGAQLPWRGAWGSRKQHRREK